MAEMGRYCKAYLVSDFKGFAGWSPKLENLRQPDADEPGKTPEKRLSLIDDDVLFLHEDLIVTDGIFRDENIVWDDVSEEWTAFCTGKLEFAVPADVAAIGT